MYKDERQRNGEYKTEYRLHVIKYDNHFYESRGINYSLVYDKYDIDGWKEFTIEYSDTYIKTLRSMGYTFFYETDSKILNKFKPEKIR